MATAVGAALVAVASVLALIATRPTPAAAGPALSALESRFLATRPTVGPTWVVDLAGTSADQQVALRTLQGIVNRTEARLYLVDGGDASGRAWIDEYAAAGLVTIAGDLTPDEMLDRFAGEAAGFVLADPSQAWSYAAAATLAATRDALVATPSTSAWLAAHGLVQVDDVTGRWPDAATAFEDVVPASRPQLDFGGIAVLRPTDTGWDFAAEQRMPVVLTRPNDPSWARVSAVITASSPGHAVYGYLSDDGTEEATAVGTLSQAGLFLVPSDTTRNLSYHVAVAAGAARERAPAPATDVAPCQADQLNVVVAISDGDNLNVPLNRYRAGDRWDSARRGELPMGWSIAPSLAVLAPAAWDRYATTAGAADELVGIIGYGYGAPAVMADPETFYRESFAAMDELGLTTFWSLGGGLEAEGSAGWSVLDAAADGSGAAGSGVPHQVLAGYGNGTGEPTQFWSAAGRPAFTSGVSYDDGPAQIAAHLATLQARAPADRPLVSFVSASLWRNTYDQLVDALRPLADAGVRFLTPAEAAACLPPAPVPPTDPDGACRPTGTITQSGHPLVSPVVAAELAARPTALPLAVTVDADPTSVVGGGSIEHHLRATIDLQTLADQVLVDRVRPLVAAGYGTDLAASAWVRLDASHLVLRVALDPGSRPGLQPLDDPVVDPGVGVGAAATARWGTDPADPTVPTVEIALPAVSATSGGSTAPVAVAVTWSTRAAARPDPWLAATVVAGPTLDLSVTAGVTVFDMAIDGSAGASWACDAPEDGRTEIAVAAVAAPTTTTEATSTTTTPSTTTTVGPETPSTTTGPSPSTGTTAPLTTPLTVPGPGSTTTSGPAGPSTSRPVPPPSTATTTASTTTIRPAPTFPAGTTTPPSTAAAPGVAGGAVAPAAAARPRPGRSTYTG